MTPTKYTQLATRTEPDATAYGAAHERLALHATTSWTLPPLIRHTHRALLALVASATRLDKVKKAVFYGRETGWTREEIAGADVHAPGAPTPLSVSAAHKRLGERRTLRLFHAAIGIATESGELVAALVAHLFDGTPLDEVNVAEEVGDVLWYVAIALDAIGLPWERVMETNIAKLQARFPTRFTEADANTRDLDTERAVLAHGTTEEEHDGAVVPPARYNRDGEREAIDLIRDLLGDEAFAGFCFAQVAKYRYRRGAKGTDEENIAKVRFYRQYGLHVQSGGAIPDPREDRGEAFVPYVRQPFPHGLYGLARDPDMGATALLTDRDTVGR